MKTNIEYYQNFSKFPFEVRVENEDYTHRDIIKVYHGENVVFTHPFYEEFNSEDLAGVIEQVFLWFFTPRQINNKEMKILKLLWEEGWRFIYKTRENDDPEGRCPECYREWDTIKVSREKDSVGVSAEAFTNTFSWMEYDERYSIANLLEREDDTDDESTN